MKTKIKCGNCGTKTAVFNPETGIGKCHICGKESNEPKTDVIGNFTIKQGVNDKNARFLEFTVDQDDYEVNKEGFKVKIKIIEDY